MASSLPGSEGETPPQQAWAEVKAALTPVLEATLAQGKRPVSPEEWQRMRQVAMRCQELGNSFQEFVIELVGEFLRGRMPPDVLGVSSLNRMSQVIGGTLCSDPASKKRLLEFQRQLLEG